MKKLRMGLAAAVAVSGLLLGSYNLSAKEQPLGVPQFMAMPMFVFFGASGPDRIYFLGSSVNTTNGSATYTFTNFDISAAPEHANRLIVVFASTPGQNQSAGSSNIGGSAATKYGSEVAEGVYGRVVATGSTATITISPGAGGSDHCVIKVYAIYPASSTQVDLVQNSTTIGTAAVTVNDLEVVAGGVVIYGAHNTNNTGTWSVTWTGADTVVEDYDTATESSAETSGHIEISASTTTDDLTATRSTFAGDRGRFIAVSWGAQ